MSEPIKYDWLIKLSSVLLLTIYINDYKRNQEWKSYHGKWNLIIVAFWEWCFKKMEIEVVVSSVIVSYRF